MAKDTATLERRVGSRDCAFKADPREQVRINQTAPQRTRRLAGLDDFALAASGLLTAW